MIKMNSGDKKDIVTGAQIRAARALLGWSGDQLSTAAGLGRATIARAELSDGPISMIPANAKTVRETLEAAGVIFIDENGQGPGVRLRKADQSS